jgi:hypothetical protein
MHWQTMPWDHFSALSPEDLTALVVYLWQLPPAPGDPDGDSFGFGYLGPWRADASGSSIHGRGHASMQPS